MTASRDPDRLIHAFLLEGEEDLHDRVYDAVRAEIEHRPQRAGSGPWRAPVMNRIVPIGLGLAAVIITLVVGLQVLGITNTGVLPGPTASPQASSTPAPSPSTASRQDRVRGWPTTGRNRAGTYSWMNGCAGEWCTLGFMHNGYGSGDVAITIGYFSGAAIPEDGVRVTVAGHDGIYHRIDAQREQWIVSIDGATVDISLTAEPGTSEADLDEAHAIIESMRTEPTVTGFKIVFTLTTDDWDSG